VQLTSESQIDYIQKLTKTIETPVQKFIPDFSVDIGQYAGVFADWITGHLSTILSSVINIVTGIVLIFISLYFFLKDGKKFKDILINLSPLKDKYDDEIFIKIKQTINSTVRGVLLVAVVQGVLSGIGMWVFGIPNATLWGSISAIASLVPGLGTAVVFIPAVLYMYIAGNVPFAIGLLLWGGLIVGLVDNVLGPYLYSKGTEVHQLIMLFSVLGGLSVFGPIGFIFGPLIIGLFFALIDIYQNLIMDNKSL
jgi:predicted PurR-regulated permease PerM